MLKHTSIGNGPPIVLLPSMLGTSESEWGPHVKTFVDMGHSVLTVDWPGHAQSDLTKSFTFRVLVEELDALFKHLKTEPALIFGYSMGGYAALHYALKNANRVVAIWMHGTKFYWSGEEAENMAAELDIEWLEENKPERLEKLRAIHGEGLDELMPWLSKMVTNLPDTGLTELELEDFKIPVLVTVGDRDELVPVAEAADLAEALPKGQLAVFADTNHPIQSARDHVLIPVLKDFLNRLD
ncbi:alpha/beta hydrolase [bacterium]|nr:alpha/beta hydrolase [bacterium]